MFIKELTLNIDYMREQILDLKSGNDKVLKEITSFGNQLINGIHYYQKLAEQIVNDGKEKFLQQLDNCERTARELIRSSTLSADPC